MADGLAISDLNAQAQRVIRDYNIDDGNGVLESSDVPRIDAASANLDRRVKSNPEAAKYDQAILRNLRRSALNPLEVPRSDNVARRITAALAATRPGDAVRDMKQSDWKEFNIDERVRAISGIVNKTGYEGLVGWWQGRVNNPREQTVIALLTRTPKYQWPLLMNALQESPGLIAQIESKLDGDESTQFRAFMQQNVWAIKDASDCANAIHQGGIHTEAAFVAIVKSLRDKRGDAFANDVLSQIVGTQDVQQALPYVFWSVPSFDCSEGFAAKLAWQALLKTTRMQNQTRFNQLIKVMPPGAAAEDLKAQFEQHNNIADAIAAADLASCAVEAVTNALQNRSSGGSRGNRRPGR